MAIEPRNTSGTVARALAYADTVQKSLLGAESQKIYATHWARFAAWCAEHAVTALPASPLTIIQFLMTLQGRSRSYLHNVMAAIQHVHLQAGLPCATHNREVRKLFRGLARAQPVEHRRAIPLEHLRAIVPAPCRPNGRNAHLRALRDRALMLLIFAGALRNCEIRRLDVRHLVFTAEGLTIVGLRRHALMIATGASDLCPVNALLEWLEAAMIREGPVFRGIRPWRQDPLCQQRLARNAIAHIVKSRLAEAGFEAHYYTPNSLRQGFIRAAGDARLPLSTVMRMADGKQPQYFTKRMQSPWNRPETST